MTGERQSFYIPSTVMVLLKIFVLILMLPHEKINYTGSVSKIKPEMGSPLFLVV